MFAFWSPLESALLGLVGRFIGLLSRLEAILGILDRSFGDAGPSWTVSGASWGLLGPPWRPFRAEKVMREYSWSPGRHATSPRKTENLGSRPLSRIFRIED